MATRISFMESGSVASISSVDFSAPHSRKSRSRSTLMNSSILGRSMRRELMSLQYDLDKHVFDSMLGCPLSSYEDATLSLVGGKALQCWRLTKQGFPVPESFVLPTYVYSMHIDEAGVVDLIEEVFSNDFSDPAAREGTRDKLATIRERILSTPLSDEVAENLELFLDKFHGAPVAVRSSGSAEDLAGQSFAGQYDTFLYKSTTVDAMGAVHLLQSRPITTIDSPGSLSFLPPGEGFWTFDPTHFPRPMTPWLAQTYSFDYADYYGRRTGCLIQTIAMRFVHSFAFSQPVFRPPSEELERAAQAYYTKKLYEDDYREFTDFFRPECEALRKELISVNPSSMSHPNLVAHVARCYDLASEFWKRHHSYTMPTMIIVGDFANRMGELMGKDPMDTLVLLENASPESRGLLNREDPLLREMYTLLEQSERAKALLLKSDEKNAEWVMDCMLHLPDRLGEVMREVVLTFGWRLAGGYDLVVPALIETPSFFLKTLLQGVEEGDGPTAAAKERTQKLVDEWKGQVTEEKHAEFDEILDVGRRFFRMRDERGLCTDLSGVGLCRRGILEGGRRLAEQGIIFEDEHLCVATKNEAIALLRGDLRFLSDAGGSASALEIPTPRALKRRFDYIKTADPSLIPRALGTPPPPPDFSALPPGIARTMAAFETGALRGIWDERLEENEDDESIRKSHDTVKGVPASMGLVEAPVRLVLQDDDLQRVKKGDIIVTYSCSASFNVVLALCSGIVTDYGGMLSHAAIVAREYGIPAVVGTQNATQKFKDGDIVRIDSSSATVRRVSAQSD